MPAAPPEMHTLAEELLATQPAPHRRSFALRLDRWWNDLVDGLRVAYPDDVDEMASRLVRIAAQASIERPDDLRELDERRLLTQDWFQRPDMLGYAAYTERFAGDLAGVADQLDYLEELGVTYLHLMPLLRPRPGANDGGYAVADYRSIRSDLGTMDDLRSLAGRMRTKGISLVVDLVLNHVAREHEWAARARAGEQRYRDYFYVYPDRTEPDAYERTLPEIFPEFAPGSFTWDDEMSGWIWTTFNSFQWDVNWSNPDVFAEYAEIVLFLANAGVEVLRLDAIAFLVKRSGTDSQNQPEVHAITQALRAVTKIVCPAVVFKAEAIVAPEQLVQYLGQGEHYGKVSDIAYHNSLMVQIWSMLATGDVTLAAKALGTLPTKPHTAAWVTYVRSHDDIGWAISDADAAAVGLSGPGHRTFLADWFSGQFPGSPARGLVFQHNKATGDRRISGTSAALAGLTSAGDHPVATQTAISRILLAHHLVMGWGGIPVLWSGDELGEPNDPHWDSDPDHAGDNRWAHRPRLDPHTQAERTNPRTVAGQLFGGLARAARIRSTLPHLHAAVETEILPLHGPGVLPIKRTHPVGSMVGLYNVSGEWRPYPAAKVLTDASREVLTDAALRADPQGLLWIPPLTAWWIVDR
ncbi:alpha-amylase family protein [Nakamurella sp. A5-74]|uniref:alpha-amylase family protein n=1 Tax=Nakamurella sp. A5-74 TaxID=3158264 RepID=UPI00336C1FB6